MENKEYYGKYYEELLNCKQIMLDEINFILNSISSDSENKPAEHVLSRLKSADSLIEKQKKSDIENGIEPALRNLSDIIGCRIVTHFVGDIYTVLDEIKNSNKWEVHTIKDYIKKSKPNGYRSLHVILKMPFGINGIDFIYTEIQMRTIAMDCWAALEHQLKYKKEVKNIELITAELKRCADELASADMSMQTLRNVIRREC